METRVDVCLERLRPARARVDLERLDANYGAIARFAERPVMPVVEADAYGHGAAVVGRRLEACGAPMLAVAYPEEGAALRGAGVAVPIVVLAGFSAGQVGLLRERRLTPVVSTPGTLELTLSASSAGWTDIEVHLKLDTGMTRLGFSPAALAAPVGADQRDRLAPFDPKVEIPQRKFGAPFVDGTPLDGPDEPLPEGNGPVRVCVELLVHVAANDGRAAIVIMRFQCIPACNA